MENDYKDVLIVETHTLIAFGLLQFVKRMMPNSRIKIAISLDEAEREVKLHTFDVFIFSISPINKALFQLIECVRGLYREGLILVLASRHSVTLSDCFCSNQINSLLCKEDVSQEFEIAMRQVLRQESYCSEVFGSYRIKLLSKIKTKTHKNDLPTKREVEVLEHIARGETTKQIAANLQIEVNTVETHRKNLIQKLYAKNATDLVIKAITKGWVTVKQIEAI